MKHYIVSYDLKNTKCGDNDLVKEMLLSHKNTASGVMGVKTIFGVLPIWAKCSLPDTTVLVECSESVTANQLVLEVEEEIYRVGSDPKRIFIAEIILKNSFGFEN